MILRYPRAAMSDNTTAHPAAEYEREVALTIPFHAVIIDQAIDVALAAVPAPRRWLDTGCGPGRLVEAARARAGDAAFLLADPSSAMIDLARARHPDLPAGSFMCEGSHALPDVDRADVITAVLCHHYYEDAQGRIAALTRLRSLLAPGGVLVTVENVRAEGEAAHALQRSRWERWQRAQGRSEAVVEVQMAREGTRFFPLRASEVRAAIEAAGFAEVEMWWRAYNQVGFWARG